MCGVCNLNQIESPIDLMMLRILFINTMCSYTKCHYLRYVLNDYSLNKGQVFKFYSTKPITKKIVRTIRVRNKNKLKLKAKPYEELLKVLEKRENFLKSDFSSQNCLSQSKNKHNNDKIAEHVTLYKASKEDGEEKGIFSVDLKKLKRKYKKSAKQENLIQDSRIQNIKKSPSAKKAKYTKSSFIKNEELEKIVKHSYAMQNLKSYIDVSINANEVEKAHKAMEYYYEKCKLKANLKPIDDVEVFNLLLSGWAQKGRLDRVKQLLALMNDDNIAPNLQSYASYLECISRSKYIDLEEIHKIVSKMKINGFTPQDIINKCIYKRDQMEKIIEVLGFVEPAIKYNMDISAKTYSCKLLEKLNDKSYGVSDYYPNFCFKKENIPQLSSDQMKLENDYILKIKSVAAVTEISEETLKSRMYLAECEKLWRKKLTIALKNIKNLEKKYYYGWQSIYPYLAVIDTEILVNLMLQEIRFLSETGEFFSPNVKVLYKNLGLKVMNYYFIWLNKKNKITDKVLFIYQKYLSYLLKPELMKNYTPREYWQYLKYHYSSGPTIDISNVIWPHSVLIYIGRYLYDILRYNISFDVNIARHKSRSKILSQAFYTVYEGSDVKLNKQIRTHSLLCKLYHDAKLDYLEFDVTVLPMVSPPRPWLKPNAGGLLITSIPFVRLPGHAFYPNATYSSISPEQLNPCFDSLNGLSLCPWMINQFILDLIIDVFRKGGNEELDIPLNPSNLTNPPKINSSMSKIEKSAVRKQKLELKKKKSEITSLWFDCLYKLSIANHFRNKIFWFPHNLDFRGRVYPTPPHFNHLGSDMARSILLFAEGKPLGPKGLDWLKIHLINLTGFKKREPNCERLRYANEMLSEILDSADKPFEGNQWWKSSDEPWQTLACCKEIANAVRSSNPEEYICHFPIHQDGSCNGLQHYAALGRDELGAREVNLNPADSPQDVYSGVASLVEKERVKDAANGIEIAQYLHGFVKRKVIKQTVMTFVYGVTMYGARLQILKQLKDIPEFPEKYYHEASIYLMKKTFLSIREMFTATKQIQDWFTECAEHITRLSGNTLEWVTPLGLPVIQPYYKETSIRVPFFCISQGNEPQANYTSKYEPFQLPNVKKQKNAFPPNFIHSLDSSHMMLTSLFCQRIGITFVSVHDCFWTHCSTIEIMNKICREQFVSLHNEPILENLSNSFLEKYSKVLEKKIKLKKRDQEKLKLKDLICQIPQKGKFNLKAVLQSEYFFS